MIILRALFALIRLAYLVDTSIAPLTVQMRLHNYPCRAQRFLKISLAVGHSSGTGKRFYTPGGQHIRWVGNYERLYLCATYPPLRWMQNILAFCIAVIMSSELSRSTWESWILPAKSVLTCKSLPLPSATPRKTMLWKPFCYTYSFGSSFGAVVSIHVCDLRESANR